MDLTELRARAEAGSTPAQAVLGVLLLEGNEGPANYPEAFRWLSAAAEKGATRAMTHLGSMYERGLGVAVDVDRAHQLYESAAERGEFLACIFLARLLASRGADPKGALRWYRAALSQAGGVDDAPTLNEARAYIAAHSGAG